MGKEKHYYDNHFLAKQLGYYSSLPEKQRRHFLAMEYERLGVGSKRQTINKGLRELALNNYQIDYSRQRIAGGGRKKKKTPLPS
jgi:hypothetical protein